MSREKRSKKNMMCRNKTTIFKQSHDIYVYIAGTSYVGKEGSYGYHRTAYI